MERLPAVELGLPRPEWRRFGPRSPRTPAPLGAKACGDHRDAHLVLQLVRANDLSKAQAALAAAQTLQPGNADAKDLAAQLRPLPSGATTHCKPRRHVSRSSRGLAPASMQMKRWPSIAATTPRKPSSSA